MTREIVKDAGKYDLFTAAREKLLTRLVDLMEEALDMLVAEKLCAAAVAISKPVRDKGGRFKKKEPKP